MKTHHILLILAAGLFFLSPADLATASGVLNQLDREYTVPPASEESTSFFQDKALPAPVYLTEDDGFSSTAPTVAADRDGNYCVAWVDQRDGNAEIYFMRITPLGEPLTVPLNVSSTSGSSVSPDIAVDDQSTAHIVWMEGSSVYFSRVDKAGVEVVDNLLISGGSCAWPSVAAIPTGESKILFRRNPISLYYLYVADVSLAGTVACEAQAANNSIIQIPNYTSIDATPAGDAVATFVDLYNFNQFATFQVWDDNCAGFGNICSGTSRSQIFNSNDIEHTSITSGIQFSFYLTFDNPSGGNRKVFSITECFTAKQVSDTAGPSTVPEVTTPEGSNCAYVVWQDGSTGTSEIRVRPDDLSVPSHVISNSTGSCTAPDISMTECDQWGAVWQENSGSATEIQFSSALLEGQGVEFTVRTQTYGEPVLDSDVYFFKRSGFPGVVRTNEYGMAWKSGLPAGNYSALATYGTELGRLVKFTVVDGEWTNVDLKVPTDVGIQGIVVDEFNGLPLSNATVRVLDGSTELVSYVTGRDGRFWIDVEAAGSYDYNITVNGRAGTRMEGEIPYSVGTGSVNLDPGSGAGLAKLGSIPLESNLVVLVHGINSSSASWDSFANALLTAEKDFTVEYDIDLPGELDLVLADPTHGWASIPTQSKHLESVLEDCERGGARSYTIVAHSQGGLVSRHFIEVRYRDKDPRVKNLFTLGTPHHGSSLASIATGISAFVDQDTYRAMMDYIGGNIFDAIGSVAKLHHGFPALLDLSPNSFFLMGLNRHGSLVPYDWSGLCTSPALPLIPTPPLAESNLVETTNYIALAGTGHSSFTRASGFHVLLLQGCLTSDGVVAAMSANLVNDSPNDNVFNWRDDDIPTSSEHKSGSAVGFQVNTDVHDWVIDLLTNKSFEPPAKSKSIDLAPSPGWTFLNEFAVEIPVAGAGIDSMMVDQADSLVIEWIWLEGDVDLALVDPTGAPVDSVTSLTNPDITYERDHLNGRGSYLIASPNSGYWQLQGSATGITEPTGMLISTASSSGISLHVNTESSFANPTDPPVIRASLFDDAGPLTGGAVESTVTPPLGVQYDIVLTDDGVSPDETADDGNYAALVPLADGAGSYQLDVVATGTSPTAFTRSIGIAFESPLDSDVQVTGLEVNPGTTLSLGTEIDLQASVVNTGTEPSRLEVLLTHEGSLARVVERTIDLPPGATFDINTVHLPLTTGEHRYVLSATPIEGSVDINLFNNGQNVLVTIVGPASAVPGGGGGEDSQVTPPLAGLQLPVDVFPNPFNPQVKIRYNVSAAADVRISVFDVSGRLVRRLFSGHLGIGEHITPWNGKDDSGRAVGSGVFFVRVQVGEAVGIKKTMLLK